MGLAGIRHGLGPACMAAEERAATSAKSAAAAAVAAAAAAAEIQFPCDLCGKVFDFQSELNKHMGRTGNRSGLGPVCVAAGERAATSAKRAARQFPCSCCGKVFGTLGNFNRHMGLTGRRLGRGPSCAAAAEREYAAAAAATEFECALCGKVYDSLWHLSRHMGKYNPDRRPACVATPERAATSTERAAAATARQFPCALCGKVFGLLSYLDQHMGFTANRTGLQPSCVAAEGRAAAAKLLPCALCGSVFRLQRNLDQHMDLIHNTRTPERAASAAVIQKPTTDNEQEFLSQQAAQNHPAVKEETVIEETVKEEPLTVKCEPKEFDVMDGVAAPHLADFTSCIDLQ
jgi:uncharacterized C2H2 Zn-finger protein